MAQIGRNEPCPCGSGKKYKKCCLAKNESAASRARGEESAIQIAIDWLFTKYPEEVNEVILAEFMGERDEQELNAIEALPPQIGQVININVGEWLLTDAKLPLNGKNRRTIDLILGSKGPRLTSAGKEWLTEIGLRSMSLYEVRELKKGEGMLLADLVHTDQEPVWVLEKSASQNLLQWDIFGARLACKEGAMVLTGAVYPMERSQAQACLEEIRDEIADGKDDARPVRQVVAWAIIDFWLESLVEERPLPNLIDAGSDEKIDLTTDRYQVLDWKTLQEGLAEQDDVDGDREEGWTRFLELEDGRMRSLAELTVGKGDTLEVFCRTLRLADETRAWLEELAGGAIVYKIRALVDPRSSKAMESIKPEPPSGIPMDVQRQVIHEYLLKHYETWPDIPLPILDGKSPLQAVKTKKGRKDVIELLKSTEQLEQQRTAQTGGEPMDIGFLWERLGIERESV